MHAVILGDTPEGLVTALALHRRGVEVTVYPSAVGRDRGMAMVLGPEIRCSLAVLGVSVPGADLGAGRLGVLRTRLDDALLAALPVTALRAGRFDGYTTQGDAVVDGRPLHADIYIGADGPGSAVRQALFGLYPPAAMRWTEVECLVDAGAATSCAADDLVPVGDGLVACIVRHDADAGPLPARLLEPAVAALEARIWHTTAFVPPRRTEGRTVLVGDAADPHRAFAGPEHDAALLDALNLARALTRLPATRTLEHYANRTNAA